MIWNTRVLSESLAHYWYSLIDLPWIKTFLSSDKYRRLLQIWEILCLKILFTFWLKECCHLEGIGWRVPCIWWQFLRFQHHVEVLKPLKEKWEFYWRCAQTQHSKPILITALALHWCVITARLSQTPAVDQAQMTANKISLNWIHFSEVNANVFL